MQTFRITKQVIHFTRHKSVELLQERVILIAQENNILQRKGIKNAYLYTHITEHSVLFNSTMNLSCSSNQYIYFFLNCNLGDATWKCFTSPVYGFLCKKRYSTMFFVAQPTHEWGGANISFQGEESKLHPFFNSTSLNGVQLSKIINFVDIGIVKGW